MRGSKQPSFVFRCDGSLSIGMGHVMRCIALARALSERGGAVYFAMRKLVGEAVERVERAGFEVRLISVDSAQEAKPLGKDDLTCLQSIARDYAVDCILVDHYGADALYLNELRQSGFSVAVIDDLADRDLTAADWMLNQNLAATEQTFRVRPDCVQLLGTQYALLRPEFAQARGQYYRRFETTDNHILITLGGSDTADLSKKVISILERVRRPLEIRCLARGMPSKLDDQRRHFQESRHHLEVISGTDEMAKEMLWADLSINAGGSTCWELLCLGVPMIVMALSEDQRSNAVALEEVGCAKRIDAEHLQSLPLVVEKLLGEPKLRVAMSERGVSLVDGQGAARVAESLMQLVKDRRRQGFNAAH